MLRSCSIGLVYGIRRKITIKFASLERIGASLATGVIWAYQKAVSPLLGHHCRFVPSCSEYARQALAKYGLRGAGLIVRRVIRCHPFGSFGYDPLP